MKRSLAVLLAVLAPLAAAAAEPVPPGTAPFSVKLEPKDVHEECMHLEAGEKRNWSWRADGPVDFNIHYHEGEDARFPVKRDAMRGDGGTFTAKVAQDYCWMWTARDKPVELEGRIAE
ncbi:MAG TPA: hypothetical protein VLS49_14790 [Usitatibacter sp.]|nr:hypothetical protein [Usitatibacter sp.]